MAKKTYLIGPQLLEIERSTGLKQKELAELLNVSAAWISRLEKNKGRASETQLNSIFLIFNANAHWLKTGEGEPGNISRPITTHATPAAPPIHRQAEKTPSDKLLAIKKVTAQDPRIDMAAKVLQSDTHYAESLDKNIHSFFSAVIKEQELSEKLKEQDRQLENQDRRITELEDFIHKILRTDKNPVNFHPAGGTFSRTARKQKRPK
jgi:transcriptional regulator with XRE-family HTH domain